MGAMQARDPLLASDLLVKTFGTREARQRPLQGVEKSGTIAAACKNAAAASKAAYPFHLLCNRSVANSSYWCPFLSYPIPNCGVG